ncbi:BSD domain-containing protein 1 [Iris pallida]|uniref:BSD domain-containing protein 1 n=1 Tax=Iris pallida TaxID=29817 RepID=A0AAX6I6Y4_IRIPA|nr:BSD domain-containing protein 1 [Iris pallida]KAJ6848761.1 BSD domain-containing protein 1 [Iris pallida]
MDFFKSVFSPDPDPSDSHDHEGDDAEQEPEREEGEEEEEEEEEASPNPNPSEASGSWSFGGMIKTLATRSESVIQTYRRDLEEFGSGLKKETQAIKEVASRVVGDLPGSLEAGASVAQGSLESVGQAIDEFGGSMWRGTAEIISQSKEALLAADSDASSHDSYPAEPAKRYTRFEAQVIAIQNDANTFVQAPEDGEDFERWKLGFRLEEKEEEIEGLLYENGVLEGFFEKFVPGDVDLEAFWCRYFYRVHKLQQAEEARAKLVQRVIASEEEEELSWEVDDDDQEEVEKKEIKEEEADNKEEKESKEEKLPEKEVVGILESIEEKKPVEEERKEEQIADTFKKPAGESTKTEIVETLGTREKEPRGASKVENSDNKAPSEMREEKEPSGASKVENLGNKAPSEMREKEPTGASKVENLDNMATSEAKVELVESSKDSDFSVITRQPSMQEEDDLGWDEIEDLGEHDDKKVGGSGGSTRKEDLTKRLTVAEDDEDLSWDIEDDEDEPSKK